MKRQNLSKFAATMEHHHHTWASTSMTSIAATANFMAKSATHSQIFDKISECFPTCRRKSNEKLTKKNSKSVDPSSVAVDLCEIDLYPSPIELNVPSEILSTAQVQQLGAHLPAIATGAEWVLTMSTNLHGFTLHALYRKMSKVKNDLPVLVVIQDTIDHVFGVLASNPLRESETYYGLGTSFLFRFHSSTNNLQIFDWKGTNFYFIKGDSDLISFGGGNGKSGLWLDGDLHKGRTEECETFGNSFLVPNKGGDFIIKSLEVWTFGW